jgi:hypothetical protein
MRLPARSAFEVQPARRVHSIAGIALRVPMRKSTACRFSASPLMRCAS